MKYVFIVGLPRTGTKLVKNILESCPYVCCRISAETWYFGDLFRRGLRSRIGGFGDLSQEDNIRRLVAYLCSGKFGRTYWTVLSKDGSGRRERLEQRILESDRSEKSIYEAIMEASVVGMADCGSKEMVLGDKTPGHLYHVPWLLQWFPEAKVIHTFRDPRAIVASENKRLSLKRGDKTAIGVVGLARALAATAYVGVTWRHAVRLHRRYSEAYPKQYCLSKYEDLVADPEKSVKRLCGFVGIEYSEQMLAPAMVGSSFRTEKDSGFDRAAIDRWRGHLRPWMREGTTALCRARLRAFDYKP